MCARLLLDRTRPQSLLALWSVLVELSRFDSNKYQAILRFKKQLFHHCEKPTETGGVLSINRSVDQFGEIAVKHLQRSFRVEFSNDEVETIISLYKSGKSTNIIAKQFGCAKATISSLLKRHKINVTNRRAQSKLPMDEVIRMYKNMNTAEKIAKHFGVSAFSIRKCLRENGVQMRNRWDYTNR